LLGLPSDLAQGYEFRSVEIKQRAFRIDGVFLPKLDATDQAIWFLEVQFQDDPKFYPRFFGEIYFYLDLYQETEDWQAVVIFPNRNIEPKKQHLYRANLNSDQVHRIYLDDFSGVPTESIGVGLMQLILADSVDAVTQAQTLLSKARTQDQTDSKITAIIELIETIVVYKFPQLSREEIERMLGLSELRETKVYQEALQEGEQTGALKEAQSFVIRLLTRRIGNLNPTMRSQIQALSLIQLETLGEALLDFSQPADLVNWLHKN
jgi:predicted transposase/invertase (TIGR01784 family)